MAMADTNKVPVPALRELKSRKDEAQHGSSFLEFLAENGYLSDDIGYRDFERLIGEWMEIEPAHIESEKEALIDTINMPEGEFAVPEHAKDLVETWKAE